jgi:hypothetical protein
MKKALSRDGRASGSAHASRGRASTLPANLSAVGPEHSKRGDGNPGGHGCRLEDLLAEIYASNA